VNREPDAKTYVMLVGGADVPEIRREIERRGHHIVTISYSESIDRMEPDPLVVHAESVDFTQPAVVARRIVALHEQYRFRAIVPVSEYGLHPAALAATQLHLPTLNIAAVLAGRDKLRMRKLLERRGVAALRFRGCQSPEDVSEFLAVTGGPVILKPVFGTGSEGISRIERTGQIAEAWSRATGGRTTGGVIVEEYIEGPELSIEGFSADGVFVGVAITDKLSNETFVETGHSQPAHLPADLQEELFAFTASVLTALGITKGVSHTEVKLGPAGPALIETHTRMGGDFIHRLTAATTGIDLAALLVAFAFGETPDVRPRATGSGAAIRYIVGSPGRTRSIVLPTAREHVEEVRAYFKPGHVITGCNSSLDRLGHVVAVAPSREAADRAAEAAVAAVEWIMEPADQPGNILVIGGAENPEVREAVTRRGFRIVTMNFPEAIAALEPDPAIVYAEGVDFAHPIKLARRIAELHAQWKFLAIVPVCDYGRQPGAIAAAQLRLPSPPMKVVQNTKDKVRMRTVLEQAGLGQVRFRKCETPGDAAEFLALLGGRMIVKPILGTGSDGVSRVGDAASLHAAWAGASSARSFGGVLCEEFIEGTVVSVEGYSVDGTFVPVAVTERVLDADGVEIGHYQPGLTDRTILDEVFAFTGKAVLALGITHGVSHTEVILSSNGPVFIETHTRNGGCRIPVMTRLTTGIDLADLQVAFALDETIGIRHPEERHGAAAVRFLPARAGVVVAANVPPADPAHGVIEAKAYVREGDVLSGRSSLLDRLAFVLTTGDDVGQACRRAEQFAETIEITIDQEAMACASNF
jgi:biotin carboxylase